MIIKETTLTQERGNMSYSNYHIEICRAMKALSLNPKTIFLGQQVGVTDFYGTLGGIPLNQRREMPVAEELQTGMAIGLALEGFVPVSIYQRMDFLPRACDQLVNHLDKIKELSQGIFNPKVIIRTTIGSKSPLDTGLQHSQDLTDMFKAGLKFPVVKVTTPYEVKIAYEEAIKCKGSYMIIEVQDLYKN